MPQELSHRILTAIQGDNIAVCFGLYKGPKRLRNENLFKVSRKLSRRVEILVDACVISVQALGFPAGCAAALLPLQ